MVVIAIIGLLAAVFVMIFGAFKGLSAIPLTLLASLVIIVCNGINVWTGYSQYYMGGFTGTLSAYLLMLMASCLYAKFMDVSGCGKSIAMAVVDKLGKKNILWSLAIICIILTWGGVSLFVCIFVIAPIGIAMLKEVNYPRHLLLTSLAVGGGCITCCTLPGTTQLNNVIPSQYLGTSLTAAPVLSIILSIVLFIAGMWYIKVAEKRALTAGEVWSDDGLPAPVKMIDRAGLPSVIRSVLPIVFMIVGIVILTQFVSDKTMLTCACMLAATLLCYILNFSKFKGVNMKKEIGNGLADGVTAIIGLASVVAFGTVVQHTVAFADVSAWVMSLPLSVYWKGVVSTAVIAGITGSGSGGLRIVFENFGDYFLKSGCDLGILHRLCALSSCTLDSLPHNSALFLVFAYLGLTHKQGYRHYWWVTVVFPSIAVVAATAVITAAGM
jgi:H+/gluconate symporter-like permease